MCDDFEDSDGEEIVNNLSWNKSLLAVRKDGYRDGIESGQEESLQSGFDSGFSAAAACLYAVARLRGRISGKLSNNLLTPGALSQDQQTQLETLLGAVLDHETHLLQFSTDYLQNSSSVLSSTRKEPYTESGDRESSFEDTQTLNGNQNSSSGCGGPNCACSLTKMSSCDDATGNCCSKADGCCQGEKKQSTESTETCVVNDSNSTLVHKDKICTPGDYSRRTHLEILDELSKQFDRIIA